MQELTIGAIAIQPTGNTQRAYSFMSLVTGQRLNRQIFNLLPLPQDVINGVYRLACRNPIGLDILDRDWCPFLDPEDGTNNDEEDSANAPSDKDISDT